jgi:hypothetical protein
MLFSAKELQGYKLKAIDDEFGRVKTLYFDDQDWNIRYLVADTGRWLPGRQVLISPASLSRPEHQAKEVPVLLTRKQVQESPDIETEKPVSRQMELRLSHYYGWPVYWGAGVMGPGVMPPGPAAGTDVAVTTLGQAFPTTPAVAVEEEPMAEPNLRSTRELMNYRIQAVDGEIGHVDDFILDDDGWTIRYLVVDTRNWLPGKKVLISPRWATEINWLDGKVHVDITRQAIRNAPAFEKDSLNRQYEEQLHLHFDRPKYW